MGQAGHGHADVLVEEAVVGALTSEEPVRPMTLVALLPVTRPWTALMNCWAEIRMTPRLRPRSATSSTCWVMGDVRCRWGILVQFIHEDDDLLRHRVFRSSGGSASLVDGAQDVAEDQGLLVISELGDVHDVGVPALELGHLVGE